MSVVGFNPNRNRAAEGPPRYEGYEGKRQWFVVHPVWLMQGMAVIAPSAQAAICTACKASGRDFRKIENYSAASARPMR